MSLRAYTRAPGGGSGGGSTDISGLVTKGSLVINAADYGYVGNGVANDGPALAAAVAATPAGGTLQIPANTTARMTTGVVRTESSITIVGPGVKILQAADITPFSFAGTYSTPLTVSAIGTVSRVENGVAATDTHTLTVGTPVTWTAGDVVKVVSDDVIPEARPASAGLASRLGEFATVREVTNGGLTVVLGSKLRETYTTNVRVALISSAFADLRGLTFDTDSPFGVYTNAMVSFSRLRAPRVTDVKILRAPSQGIIFRSCYGYRVHGVSIGFARNNPDGTPAQFGYGILDNSSAFGKVASSHFGYVRHAWTDDTSRIAAATSDLTNYGRSYNANVDQCSAQGTALAAWDTHHAGEGHTFTNCVVTDSHSAYGFQLRGKNHRVIAPKVRNCRGGVVVAEEAAGGLTYGMVVENPDVRDVSGSALTVALAPVGHPTAGVRRQAVAMTVTGTALVRNAGTVADLTNGLAIFTNGVDADGYTTLQTLSNATVNGLIQPVPGGWLNVGQETVHRQLVTSSTVNWPISSGSNVLRLARLTSRRTETVSTITVNSGSTLPTGGASAITTARLGLYQVNDDGSLTLLASTANDTSLFAAASTLYAKTLNTPVTLVKGREYAIGALVVHTVASGTALPSICSNAPVLTATAMSNPGFAWTVPTQSDLPASVAAGSLATSTATIYAVVS